MCQVQQVYGWCQKLCAEQTIGMCIELSLPDSDIRLTGLSFVSSVLPVLVRCVLLDSIPVLAKLWADQLV